jgi:sulfate permease, SulP family
VAWREPEGVAVLGPVPSGLPPLTIPVLPLEAWLALLPVSLAIAVLTVAEGVLISQSAARRTATRSSPNGEVYAYGLANTAAAFTGGMPVGASASRTAALEDTGARTQVPMVVAALAAAIVAAAFTGVLAAIPMAALGGLVANAVVGLVNVPAFRHLARVRRSEFVIALGSALGVLVLGPLPGIAVAAVASAVDVVRRAADLPWARLEEVPDPDGTPAASRGRMVRCPATAYGCCAPRGRCSSRAPRWSGICSGRPPAIRTSGGWCSIWRRSRTRIRRRPRRWPRG